MKIWLIITFSRTLQRPTNVMYSQKDNFSSCGRRMNTSVITVATAVSAFATLCICTAATAINIYIYHRLEWLTWATLANCLCFPGVTQPKARYI